VETSITLPYLTSNQVGDFDRRAAIYGWWVSVGKTRHRAHTESQREESGESQFQGSLWRATLSREAWMPIWGLSTESMSPGRSRLWQRRHDALPKLQEHTYKHNDLLNVRVRPSRVRYSTESLCGISVGQGPRPAFHKRRKGMRTRSHAPCRSSAAGRASMCIATGLPAMGLAL